MKFPNRKKVGDNNDDKPQKNEADDKDKQK